VWGAVFAIVVSPALVPQAHSAVPVEYRLNLAIQDEALAPFEARVRILGSDGRVHPDTLEATRMVHLIYGGYFYAEGFT
jgi:hypothetical protein